MLSWTQEQSNYWVADQYAVKRVEVQASPKRHAFEVVSAPKNFRDDERVHDTLGGAQGACAYHDQVEKVVASAPPLSRKQQVLIANVFASDRAEKRIHRKPRPANAPSPKGLSRRRLPGEARPNDEVLREWRELADKSPMRRFWYGDPEDVFRWRAQFDCGCVEERFGHTDDPHSLLDYSDVNPYTGDLLPAGQYWCSGQHDAPELPLRAFKSWDRYTRRLQAADPVECPEEWRWRGKQWWDIKRHKEPRWVHDWEATLTCGHTVVVDSRDVAWAPDQIRESVAADRLAELRKRFSSEPYSEYVAKMLDAGWPELGSYRDCNVCPIVRKLVAFEPLGWLVPPPPSPRKQKTPKERMQTRLRELDREAKRLRDELKRIEGAD